MKKTFKALLLIAICVVFTSALISCEKDVSEASVNIDDTSNQAEYEKIHENEYYIYYSKSGKTQCKLSLNPDFKTCIENSKSYLKNDELLWSPDTPLPSFNSDYAKVVSIANIFENSIVENLDLSEWDTTYITDISSAFNGCSDLTILDLSSFDTSYIKEYENAFSYCSNLKTLLVKNNNNKLLIEKSISASDSFSENCSIRVLSSIRWIAIGDSITQGYYSKEDKTYSKVGSNGWAAYTAAITGMNLTNKGVGGTGFVDTKSKDDSSNGRTIVDEIDFSDYDVATIAYGVNDWKGYRRLGNFDDDIEIGGTIYSNMRYIVEKILSDNPSCQIIVITPLNCWAYGTYDNNWGIGYKFNSTHISLADVFDAEKEICEHYGLDMIDMTYDTFIDRDNIQNYMFDKVHPSIECHKLLGKELAHKIKFLL